MLSVLGVALLAWGALRLRPRPSARGANLLLVTIDTLRADRVGAYGAPDVSTPNLDGLARHGLLFDDALASVPLTLPSHATILSGLEPPHHGVRANGADLFPPDRETLATVLESQGYATAAFVGAYVLDRRFGLARGFDTYDDRIERRPEGASPLESERPCNAVVDIALPWLAAQSGPFFAWAHFYDPHAPYEPPPPFAARFAGRPYDGEVAYADQCLGRLLAALKGAGARTVVAVVGDHGKGLGDHGERTHGFFVYRSTLRVPFILSGPGLPNGRHEARPARTVDLAPTLLGLLGVPKRTQLDGVDLLRHTASTAYAETHEPQTFGWAPLFAVQHRGLRYIEAPRPELYDVRADPGETQNLVAQRPQEVAEMKSSLASVRAVDVRSRGRVDKEATERLQALGYLVSGPGTPSGVLSDPKDALPLFRLFEDARAREASGDRLGALADFGQLVAQDPQNAAFRRALAAAQRRTGSEKDALATLEALLQLAPNDALVWHERAVALAALGRVKEAVASEQRSVAADPLLAEAWNHLGILEATQGRAAPALAAFEKASGLDPGSSRTYCNKANALRELGRRQEAEAAYREAARLAPRDPDPPNGLGVVALEMGASSAAETFFRQALALDPSFDEAKLNLAVALSRQGGTAEARALLAQVVRAGSTPALRGRAQHLLAGLPR